VDVLLISPERLANTGFRDDVLVPVAERVGLFVVDEAHCISDWGHDFRPDYRRIVRVLQALPPNIPVLATTATASDRVVQDVAAQLGDLLVERGPLIRSSLRLQNIWLPSPAARMAWMVENIPTAWPGWLKTYPVCPVAGLCTPLPSGMLIGSLNGCNAMVLKPKLIIQELRDAKIWKLACWKTG